MAKKDKQTITLLNNAVQSGIELIIKEHPRFANFRDYLIKHIDQKKIQEKFFNLYKRASESGMNEKEASIYVHNNLSNYVASGSVLDEKGKEIILKSGLEEKTGFFHKLFYRPKFNRGKYLDNTMEAFNDMYTLFKSGNYSERMSELVESVGTLKDLNFLDPAVDILKSYGLIDNKKHRFLKENIYRRAKEESQKTVKGIENYFVPQKVAALIIGGIGVILIAFNLSITGAVVGNNFTITKEIIGVFMIIFASLLFLMFLKKSFKK